MKKKIVSAVLATSMCASMMLTPIASYADYPTAYVNAMNYIDGKTPLYNEVIESYAEVATVPRYNDEGRLIGYDFAQDAEKIPVSIDFTLYNDSIYSINIDWDESVTIPASKVVQSDDSYWTGMRIFGLDTYAPFEHNIGFGASKESYVTFEDSEYFVIDYADTIDINFNFTEGTLNKDLTIAPYSDKDHTVIMDAGLFIPGELNLNNYYTFVTGTGDDLNYIVYDNNDKANESVKVTKDNRFITEGVNSAVVSDGLPAFFNTTMTVDYSNGTRKEYPTVKVYDYDSETKKLKVSYLYNTDFAYNNLVVVPDEDLQFTETIEPVIGTREFLAGGFYYVSESQFADKYNTMYYTFNDDNNASKSSFYWVKNSFANPKMSITSDFSNAFINKTIEKLGNTDLNITKINPMVSNNIGNFIDNNKFVVDDKQQKVELTNGNIISASNYNGNNVRKFSSVNWMYPELYSITLDACNTTKNAAGEDVIYFYDSSDDVEIEVKTGEEIKTDIEEVVLAEEAPIYEVPTESVTEESSEATEDSSETTEQTEDSSETTEPSSEATEQTEPSSEATEPSSEATEKTEESSEATEPSSEATEATEPSTEESTEIILGDADCDGDVDIIDVITVNKSILGKDIMSKQGILNCDLNKNNVPDSTDSLNIMKLIVGLITKEEVMASWK